MTKQEQPLRGWKEITEYLRVADRKTAIKILSEKNLLIYESGTPVLMVSVYQMTLNPAKSH